MYSTHSDNTQCNITHTWVNKLPTDPIQTGNLGPNKISLTTCRNHTNNYVPWYPKDGNIAPKDGQRAWEPGDTDDRCSQTYTPLKTSVSEQEIKCTIQYSVPTTKIFATINLYVFSIYLA